MRGLPKKLVVCLSLAVLCCVVLSSVASAASIVILFGGKDGEPISGQILKHDEDGFVFKPDDLDTPVTLRWVDLDTMQVQQIQKRLGIRKKRTVEEGVPDEPVGDVIEALKVKLKVGKEFLGVELPERSDAKVIFISMKRIKEFKIDRADIESIERVKARESLVRSLAEMYRRKVNSVQPKTAKQHYDVAEYCRAIGNIEKAREHYEKCQVLDPRYTPRITDKMAALNELAKRQRARQLNIEIGREVAANGFDEALKKIELLNSGFPDSEYTTKWLAQVPAIEAARTDFLRRKVITGWYVNIDQYVRDYIYKGITDVPDVPMKIVRTRGNRVFKGLLDEETEDEIVLKSEDGNIRYRIARQDIVSITSATVARDKRDVTFAEAKAYGTDTDGGISRDVALKVAKIYNITEEVSKEMWQQRLKKTYFIKGGDVDSKDRYYSFHQADYGKGSWLREGAEATVDIPNQGGGNRNQQQPSGDASTDPEEWWKVQKRETRVKVLRAICYEALMEVTRTHKVTCGNCGGKGFITRKNQIGESSVILCPRCHGVRVDYRIIVR